MNIKYNRFPARNILSLIQHYNAKKYWERREYVIHVGGGKAPKANLSNIH